MKKLLIGLMFVGTLFGQGQSVDFTAPPPAPVVVLSVSPTGVTGTTSYYYFIATTYPIGSAISAPFLITNSNATLSVSNFNTVFWSPATGATSYTVLRSTSSVLSLPCAACVVAAGITTTSQTDQSNATSASNITLATSASGYIRINNRDFSAARLQSSLPFQLPQLIFDDGTSMITANAGTPSGPAGGVLTGTYPNPGLGNSVVLNANLQSPSTTVNGQLCTLGAACTISPFGINATYITQIPDANLSNEQALSLLGTGLMKNTNATGVVSIAASTDVIGLFTGCSGVQYLGADGACHASGGTNVVGSSTVLASAASLGPTNLLAGATAGVYEVKVYIATSTGGTGNVITAVNFTDAIGTKVVNVPATLGLGTGDFVTGSATFQVVGASTISYATTYAGTGNYNIYVALIRIL